MTSVTWSKRTGTLCERLVGYDRFAGELAYRQLTELYRALRLYVNCFQPSMKLQSKQREGSKVHRTYDQAQTPMQRLLASGILSANKQHELLRITQAASPLALAHAARTAPEGASSVMPSRQKLWLPVSHPLPPSCLLSRW